MDDHHEEVQRVQLPKWPLILIALYTLSMGPFWALREHGVIVRGAPLERGLVTFYSPIELVVRHVPPFKAMLKWYHDLFVGP